MKNRVLIPYSERVLDAQSYLKELQNKRDNIAKVEFIPPKIGKQGYGKFRIHYKIPVLLEVDNSL